LLQVPRSGFLHGVAYYSILSGLGGGAHTLVNVSEYRLQQVSNLAPIDNEATILYWSHIAHKLAHLLLAYKFRFTLLLGCFDMKPVTDLVCKFVEEYH